MKRFLFFAACASLTLAGCVNDERLDTNEVFKKDANKITFSTPVIGANSRAEIEGGAYPEDETFNVFAVRHDAEFLGWDVHFDQNDGHYFINDEEVSLNTSSTGTKTWETENEYYWPIGKFVTFGAYSPSKVKLEADNVGYDGKGLYITDFEVPEIGEQYDLMFSRLAIGKTAGSGSSSATYSGVDLRFNHALSAIVFKAKAGGDFDAWIHKIELVDVHYKGSFSQGISSSAESSIQLQEFGNPVWSRTSEVTSYVVYDKGDTEGILLTSEAERINPETLLLLPQPFAKNVVDNPETEVDESANATSVTEAKIKVTYKVGSNQPNSVEESIFDLSQHWAMGTRYIYTIEIGTKGTIKKITFSPSVEPWIEDGYIMEF